MKNENPQKQKSMIGDIHNLLGKYFSGEATAEEKEAIQQWKAAQEEHALEFNDLEKLWNGLDGEEERPFDTARAWTRVDGAIQATRPVRQAPVFSMRRLAVAAAAVIIIAIGLWWIQSSGNTRETLVAQTDGQLVTLEDGTKVYLRKGAQLDYPESFEKDSRQISLQGAAFFDVAHDAARPFSITADEARITVLGTSFSVDTKGEEVTLVVKTGRVRFASAGDSSKNILVVAGERAEMSAAGAIQKTANTDSNFNSWQTGTLSFDNVPLEQAVQALSRHYNVSISINKGDAAQIASKGVTNEFKNLSLEQALKELELITTYQVRKLGSSEYEISIR